jgi:DHA2 family multidrug resistance protein-like MFS transporter
MVSVALPTMASSLQVTPAEAVRVVTAYQLGLVVSLLPAAALGESLGYRRVFAAGVALFTGASVFCALSRGVAWLLAARLLQGVGGAAVMALGVALLRAAVPPHRLGAAIGWNAIAVALASAAGPALGAAVLSVAPWPWLFAINLPLGGFVLLAACGLPGAQGTGRPVDLVSVGLNVCVFAGLVLSAERMPSQSALAGALLFGAVACAAVLVRREVGRAAPLVPVDLLSGRAFRVSVLASCLCFAGQGAALVALPFHLQREWGLTAWRTGLCLTPWPLAVALAGPLAGRLAERIPTARLCGAGGGLLATGLAAAALLPAQGGAPWLAPCIVLCGLGFGLFNVPNNRSMFLSAPQGRSGAAGGLQSLARLSGQTTGAVAVTLLFSLTPMSGAPRLGLALAAAVTLAAGVVSLLRLERPAAATDASLD